MKKYSIIKYIVNKYILLSPDAGVEPATSRLEV